jgi:hypothetical protein
MLRIIMVCTLAVTVASCFVFDSEEARVSFAFTNYAQVKREMIRLTFADGKRILRLDGTDFESQNEGPHSIGMTRAFKTATSGKLKVTFKLLDIVCDLGWELDQTSSGLLNAKLRCSWKVDATNL